MGVIRLSLPPPEYAPWAQEWDAVPVPGCAGGAQRPDGVHQPAGQQEVHPRLQRRTRLLPEVQERLTTNRIESFTKTMKRIST